ncbi:hypothetical protein OE09_1817 [Flavobacteriaceae bacterium MAR_2010_72]|nr:hypothetical protein OE09_1817 [Flavobacteriaceae bacterium MAR_2010_72]
MLYKDTFVLSYDEFFLLLQQNLKQGYVISF